MNVNTNEYNLAVADSAFDDDDDWGGCASATKHWGHEYVSYIFYAFWIGLALIVMLSLAAS